MMKNPAVLPTVTDKRFQVLDEIELINDRVAKQIDQNAARTR